MVQACLRVIDVYKRQDWIRPGKIIRETTITTEGAIATIDFLSLIHISGTNVIGGWLNSFTIMK